MYKKCVICSNEFKTYRKTQQTCSTVCMGKNKQGQKNPNYGNKWSAEKREAASIQKIEQFKNNPDYAYSCGKSNRGVKFSKERILAMHSHRTSDSYKHSPTDDVKKVIGKKSKEKWTPEYKEKHRKSMEEKGHWIPLKDKNPYNIYYKEANWSESMIDYFNATDLEKLNEYGLFGRKNTKGWVRDHIVSRMIGYEFGLPAYILRHPANLQFISHSNNISKGFADRKLTKPEKECIINVLLERIVKFNTNWKEQEVCLDYIRNRNEDVRNRGFTFRT